MNYSDMKMLEHLKLELSMRNKIESNEIMEAFSQYVDNKNDLSEMIELGMLRFEYSRYASVFKDTLFEDGIKYIVELAHKADNADSVSFREVYASTVNEISKGLSNWFLVARVQAANSDYQRIDVWVKSIFRDLGDLIESSLQPYLKFILTMEHIAKNRSVSVPEKLGAVVNELRKENDLYQALLCSMPLDISVSQWRNIADHGDYSYLGEEQIEVCYGTKNDAKKKILEKSEIQFIAQYMDALLYMFKLADTLLRIDFHPLHDIPEWTEETATDNWISQLVETSYTYDIEVVSMDDTAILLRMDSELSRQDIEKFIKSLPITLKREFEMCLVYKDVVRCIVKFDGKKVEITCLGQGKKKVPFWRKFLQWFNRE